MGLDCSSTRCRTSTDFFHSLTCHKPDVNSVFLQILFPQFIGASSKEVQSKTVCEKMFVLWDLEVERWNRLYNMFHELKERIYSFFSVCGMLEAVVLFKFEICREQTFLRLVLNSKVMRWIKCMMSEAEITEVKIFFKIHLSSSHHFSKFNIFQNSMRVAEFL